MTRNDLVWLRTEDDLDAFRNRCRDADGAPILAAIGDGLTTFGNAGSLLAAATAVARESGSRLVLWTGRGTIAQDAVSLSALLESFPRTAIALDLAEWYCAHEMVLGSSKRWNAAIESLADRVFVVFDSDGGAEFSTNASQRSKGFLPALLRAYYRRRVKRWRRVCERANEPA